MAVTRRGKGGGYRLVLGVFLWNVVAPNWAQQPTGSNAGAARREIQEALSSGDPEGALTLANRALTDFKDQPLVVVPVSLLKAAALRQSERPQEALTLYAELVAKYPKCQQQAQILWEQANLIDPDRAAGTIDPAPPANH